MNSLFGLVTWAEPHPRCLAHFAAGQLAAGLWGLLLPPIPQTPRSRRLFSGGIENGLLSGLHRAADFGSRRLLGIQVTRDIFIDTLCAFALVFGTPFILGLVQ